MIMTPSTAMQAIKTVIKVSFFMSGVVNAPRFMSRPSFLVLFGCGDSLPIR
jgi:hypothetical protein